MQMKSNALQPCKPRNTESMRLSTASRYNTRFPRSDDGETFLCFLNVLLK